MSLATDLVADSKADLDARLEGLANGPATEQLKATAVALAELAIDVMVEKGNGADTAVAEAALAASAKNLAARRA